MRHPDYPDRICDISEKEFWGSLQTRGLRTDVRIPRDAIQAGKAGRRGPAYLALAEHHAFSLKPGLPNVYPQSGGQ